MKLKLPQAKKYLTGVFYDEGEYEIEGIESYSRQRKFLWFKLKPKQENWLVFISKDGRIRHSMKIPDVTYGGKSFVKGGFFSGK